VLGEGPIPVVFVHKSLGSVGAHDEIIVAVSVKVSKDTLECVAMEVEARLRISNNGMPQPCKNKGKNDAKAGIVTTQRLKNQQK
jgi:hypothetical protein